MHQFHHRVYRIYLEPSLTKIGAVGMLVVVVLEQLAQHQEIKGRGVFGLVFIVKISVPVFVPAPVYYGPMDRAHEVMHR